MKEQMIFQKKIRNKKTNSGWWFQTFFISTPNPGEMIQFDEHMFQRGWFKPPTRPVDKTMKNAGFKAPIYGL